MIWRAAMIVLGWLLITINPCRVCGKIPVKEKGL